MTTPNTNRFYIYEHWRPDKNECFYVGKGFGRRAYNMYSRNGYHKAIQAKLLSMGLSVEIRIVWQDLSEIAAFEFEVQQIRKWREDGAKLANLSTGGEGPSGMRHTEERKLAISKQMMGRIVSEETRKRHSVSGKGKCGVYVRTDEQRAKLSAATRGKPRITKGRKLSDAHRAALAAAHVGLIKSPETCAKLSEALKGHVISEETRRKIGAANKLAHARKKMELVG